MLYNEKVLLVENCLENVFTYVFILIIAIFDNLGYISHGSAATLLATVWWDILIMTSLQIIHRVWQSTNF